MKLSPPTPALPVRDVREAQEFYRDQWGFEIAWHHEEGRIGAVAHGDCALFLREAPIPAEPSIFWIYAEDVDAAHATLKKAGADIVEPLEDKPWGLRQFTIRDLNGNLFHVHHDL